MATRDRQKLRTRRALLEAARQMIREGSTPTVPAVAERALVSKATAYRYFPSRDSLLEETELDFDAPTEESIFGKGDPPASAEDRVSLVRAAFHDFSTRNDLQYRIFLRNWHDRRLRQEPGQELETRGARRAIILERALRPLRSTLDKEALERLKAALSVMVGIESVIVLDDVLGLERKTAEEIMDWAVRTLVRAAANG